MDDDCCIIIIIIIIIKIEGCCVQKYCRVFITIYCVVCCVYYSLLLVIRSAMVN